MELIERDNVIAYLNAQIEKAQQGWLHDYGFPTSVIASLTDAKNLVKNLPTIEAEPIRHGRWIVNGRNPDYVDCTNCGLSEWIGANGSRAYAETLLSGFKKYCPNCGARMDGGAENG